MKLYRPFVLLFLFALSTIALSFSAPLAHAAGAVPVCDERHPCEAPSGGEVALIAPGSRPADAVTARPETASSAVNLNLPFAFYATQISAGWYHTCILTTAGGVKCWGRNDDGQLGNNTWTHSHMWVDVWTGAGNSTPLSGVVAIAAGSYHTCALTTSGGVKCWGYNSYGQLGNNSWSSSSVPVDVSGLTSGVVAITAGNSDTCALTTAGGVKCWGLNSFGALGNNSTTNSNVPVDVTGLASSVRAIAAGGYHTCALTAAGGLKCWGYNNAGQLGNNTWADSHIPVDVVTSAGDSTPLSGVRMMAGGTYHTCAVTTSGGVKCWGYNPYGQLGGNSYSSSNVPVDVWAGAGDSTPLSGISAITAGENHTCALTTNGGLKCWGSGDQSQIGTSSTTPVPVNMTTLTSGVSAVAAGKYHTCAVTTSGGVKCVGDNSYGELGNNSTTNSQSPVDVSGLSSGSAITIAAGYYYSCAVTASGGVKCWGRNDYGQLGNNSTSESHVPVDVWTGSGNSTPLSGMQAIAVNYMHTCALTTSGGVKCWGLDDSGQLGNGVGGQFHVPVNVVTSASDLTPLSGVSAIGVGGFHTCALTTSGGVKCWGNNQFGQLGNNSTMTSATPVDVSGLTSGVSAISVGYSYACALTTGGGVKCWGRNDYGQLGNNSTSESHVPVDVWTSAGDSTPLSGVRAIAGGGYHTCAVMTSGGGKCWGANFYGQLGNNSTADSHTPVDVCADSTCASSLTGVSALSPGYFDTCALTTSGGAKCWGANTDGQVGDNSTTSRHAPVDVCADSACATRLTGGVSEISVGYEHACALTTGGGAKCWGDNGQGGLGDNSTTIRHTPTQVVGLLSSALPIVQLFANPVQAGDAVSFAATVSGPVDPLSGTIQFQVDGADLDSPVSLSGGSATSPSTTGLALGLHRITAIYSGNSNFNLSRAASVVQAVLVSTNADLDNLVLSSGALTPAFVSATTVYTAAVANDVPSLTVTPTAANPNATITVNGITVASGSASSPIALAVGDNTITTIVTAQDGLTTKTYTVTVTRLRVDTTTSLTSLANPSILGQAVTFTAQVSPTPTGGTMTFRDNGVDITGCTDQPVDGSGQATCTTSALTLGSHTITAFYSGDTNYNPSDNTASPLAQTVNCFDTITVTNANDSGAGSLRQALVSLCSGGAITFDGDYTIPLGSPLTIGKNMTIDGTGRSVTISGDSDSDGDGDVRVLFIPSSVAATLTHLSIVSGTVGGGYTCSSTNCGGGIYNQGALVVLDSIITGGSALYGGGIYNQGTLTVQASTLANNYAGYGGGGIANASGEVTVLASTLASNSTGYNGGGIYNNLGKLTVQTCTLAGNSAGSGGGIANESGTALKVYNSTLSGNSGSNGGGGILNYGTWLDLFHTIIANSPEGGDCVHVSGGGGWVSSGYGLIESTGAAACGLNSDYSTILGVDPLLGPLTDNGGSTQTFALLPGSPAIDAGQPAGCATDQRGVARPQGTACDIGAFESRGFTLTISGGDNQSTGINTAFSQPLSLIVSSAFGEPVGPGGVISYTAPTVGPA